MFCIHFEILYSFYHDKTILNYLRLYFYALFSSLNTKMGMFALNFTEYKVLCLIHLGTRHDGW